MYRQTDLKIVKWSAAVGALAIALFGCGGNSVSGSGTTSTSSGTSAGTSAGTNATSAGGLFPEVTSVNLADAPGFVQYAFLTGAGRAADSEIVSVSQMELTDNLGVVASGVSSRRLTLTSAQSQLLQSNVSLLGRPSRTFNTVALNLFDYNATLGDVPFSSTSVFGLPATAPSKVSIFNGRQIHIPIFLDGEVVNVENVDDGNGNFNQEAVYQADWFKTINQLASDQDTGIVIRSFLSDYVAFDISAMPASQRPTISLGNGVANRVFFSGDQYALGGGDPANGGTDGAPFETIFPGGQDFSVVGRYSAPATIPGGFGGSVTPGSYTTLNADPTDLTTTDPALVRKITSFQGVWRDFFKQRQNPQTGGLENLGYFKNLHAFEAVSVPSSDDDERQDVIFTAQTLTTNSNGTQVPSISKLYWGFLSFDQKKVYIYPIKNLGDTNATQNRVGEVVGDLGTQYNSTGGVTTSPQQTRYVDFTMSGAPSGFPSSGKIVVLRR